MQKENLSWVVYMGFKMAKEGVKKNFNNVERDYKPIWEIMERRWDKHFQSPLFKAGAFLNPKSFYELRRY